MKVETGRFKRQVQVLEQAMGGLLLCGNHLFIREFQQASRQYPVPVRHELAVAYIEIAELGQVIGERISLVKSSFVDGVTRGEWMPGQVHDARLGERAEDQRAVVEVGGLLVRKAWPTAAPRARAGQVLARDRRAVEIGELCGVF